MAYLQTCISQSKIYSHVKNNFVYTLFNVHFLYTILYFQTDTYLKKFSWKSIDFFFFDGIA